MRGLILRTGKRQAATTAISLLAERHNREGLIEDPMDDIYSFYLHAFLPTFEVANRRSFGWFHQIDDHMGVIALAPMSLPASCHGL